MRDDFLSQRFVSLSQLFAVRQLKLGLHRTPTLSFQLSLQLLQRLLRFLLLKQQLGGESNLCGRGFTTSLLNLRLQFCYPLLLRHGVQSR